MDVTRFFGTHRFAWLMELGRAEGCAWHLMRRELDGARFLAQIWSPLPTDRDLDQIRDTFLARFLDAAPLDPVAGHIGFDHEQAWCLQALQGTPLSRLWAGWGDRQRSALRDHLAAQLQGDPHPRFLHPEVITFRPGLTQIPRLIGTPPWGPEAIPLFLTPTAPAPALSEDLPWTQARDLSETVARPLRGRGQELPYLKSLMLGLSAPIPMERIVLLQGEEGVGKEHLAAWACAVAEGEGIWVHDLAASSEEPPGRFLGRLLESLLLGSEVDFYAEKPHAAKALSLRLQAFAFLTGGRHLNGQELGPEPEEIRAALEAMDFAGLQHHRLIHLSGLDRATPGVLGLIRELVHASHLPWLLSLTSGAQGAGLKPLLTQLRGEPAAALVGVNRLEDEDLRLVLEDLLGTHELPEAFRTELITQSLGNPGLLQNFLELAQQSGTITWERDRWILAPGQHAALKAEDDLMRQIFLGRLQRLTAASAAVVRLLALAERPLPAAALGRVLGLQGDALEDALHLAEGSRLVQFQRGLARIPEPRWRELVLAHTPQPELKRLARALVSAFQEQGWSSPLTLQSLASDEATALAAVLASLDKAPPGPPGETRRLVDQALQLKPAPADEARLLEHLADAWASGVHAPESIQERPPGEEALEALTGALNALARVTRGEGTELVEARLYRKRAMLHLHLRRPAEAQEALQAAARRLMDHPLHPEQPRLRLALGQLHLLQGHLTKGIRALEEGLQPQGGFKPLPQDQAALMLVLGRALAGQSQFLRAAAMLQSAQRMLEHGQGFRSLVPVQIALAEVRLAQGQSDTSVLLLREALQTARMQGDLALQAQGHLALGMVRSLQQFLGPALSHLDRALSRAQRLGDTAQVFLIQTWRARTFAALGDTVSADHAQFQALADQPALLSPEEQGDHLFLQGEVARFRSAWRDGVRLFRNAADHYERTGLLWRQRLALLRFSQAVAREARQSSLEAPEQGWAVLENLKGPVEGSGSRWLDLEWHRAHALLLSTVPATEAVVQEALEAWGQVQAAARDMQFPALVLEASSEGAQLLLQRGEKLGARARMQDAFPSFQQLWTRLPEGQESTFLGREDLHRFRRMVEAVGLKFIQPERADPLVDWTPTQMNLPAFPDPE
ncbi:MAG: putative LuxR family transcriptional regulator [Holophagaceae bacterium]|nr:putative LuxR family transcriptional regulator [Holophagaceae bacterium]